jgi:hypothetical protein
MKKDTPGVIYELRCNINNEWHPFYVGETSNPSHRLSQHRIASVTGETLVYKFIREVLLPADIEWGLFIVQEYPANAADDLEDEHIMKLLQQGILLKNMKKGNSNWMQNMMEMAKDMTKRNINSYRQYRKIVEAETLEELTRQAEEKHRQWLHREAVERMKKDTRAKRQIDLEKEKQRHELSMANVAVLLNTIKRK